MKRTKPAELPEDREDMTAEFYMLALPHQVAIFEAIKARYGTQKVIPFAQQGIGRESTWWFHLGEGGYAGAQLRAQPSIFRTTIDRLASDPIGYTNVFYFENLVYDWAWQYSYAFPGEQASPAYSDYLERLRVYEAEQAEQDQYEGDDECEDCSECGQCETHGDCTCF